MKSLWLEKIEAELPEIMKVVAKCEEPYRQKCFELILTHSLSSIGGNGNKTSSMKNDEILAQKNENISDTEAIKNSKSNTKFERFLSENAINESQINNLIDLESGEIIGSKLGDKGSDITRNIAVLLAMWHFSKDGEFLFDFDELVKKTHSYGVQFHNHKRDLRAAIFEGKKAFIENGSMWRIPTQTQGYIVNTIKELINPGEKK